MLVCLNTFVAFEIEAARRRGNLNLEVAIHGVAETVSRKH